MSLDLHKDSLFIAKEFLNARKMRTLQGANQNSPDKSGSDNDLLFEQKSRPHFLARIPETLHKLSFVTREELASTLLLNGEKR